MQPKEWVDTTETVEEIMKWVLALQAVLSLLQHLSIQVDDLDNSSVVERMRRKEYCGGT